MSTITLVDRTIVTKNWTQGMFDMMRNGACIATIFVKDDHVSVEGEAVACGAEHFASIKKAVKSFENRNITFMETLKKAGI